MAWVVIAGLGTSCLNRIPTPAERLRTAEDLAKEAGFERVTDDDYPFDAFDAFDENTESGDSMPRLPVAAWQRDGPDESSIHVYIEGDGLAWQTRHRISDDPTPVRPIGLMLAASDPSRATVIYLGRPCQYVKPGHPDCVPRVWTSARFGEGVIRAVERRLAALLEGRSEIRLRLIGFSGGGVVATLVAARRAHSRDVALLVTMAAPLDLDGWTRDARVSPLVNSLSPMSVVGMLEGTRQVHFVGGQDRVVPQATTEAFRRAQAPSAPSRVVLVEGMDHLGWPGIWARLIDEERLFPERASRDDVRFEPESSTTTGHP